MLKKRRYALTAAVVLLLTLLCVLLLSALTGTRGAPSGNGTYFVERTGGVCDDERSAV